MIFFLFLIHSSFLWRTEAPLVENLCGIMYPWYGDQDWGDGAIAFPSDSKYILYSDTTGTVFGFLRIFDNGWDIRDEYEKPINEIYQNKEGVKYNSISLGILNLGYFKLAKVSNLISERFYLCFEHVRLGGLYLKKSEVKEKGGIYSSYLDLIFKYSNGITYDSFPRIGVNIPEMCLNIRSGPSINSTIIGCVHSNDANPLGESRIEVLEQKGNWAKVRVVNLYYVNETNSTEDKGPDWGACPNTLHSELTGWMKVVDENGFPKIWFSSPA